MTEAMQPSVSSNRGVVVAVRGSVVDVRFDTQLPPIHSILRAGEKGRIVIEVLAQRDSRYVRGNRLGADAGAGSRNGCGHQQGVSIFCGIGERCREGEELYR